MHIVRIQYIPHTHDRRAHAGAERRLREADGPGATVGS